MRPYALLTALLLGATLLAQSPQAFNYQGVARDASGDELVNTAIGVQFQLHQGTAVGTVVYSETHSPTTNDLGLFSLGVGNGTPDTGTFAAIDWSAGPYYLEVGMDPAGGSSYTSVGTQQLLSVPYALHAKTADMADDGDWVINGDTLLSDDKEVRISNSTSDAPLTIDSYFYGLEHRFDFSASEPSVGEIELGTFLGGATGPGDAGGWLGTNSNHPLHLYTNDGLPQVTLHTSGNLGIGTMAPEARLHVAGGLKLQDGSQGDRRVLTSDADGDASWQDMGTSIFGNGNLPPGDPSCISLAGSLGIGVSPWYVAVSGTHAYVVETGSNDLKVIDISDPTAPFVSGSVGIGTSPVHLAVSGSYVYVVDIDDEDLKVIDVGDPGAPVLVGSLAVGLTPTAVAVSGNLAYVVHYGPGSLKVIDISDPSAPAQIGSLSIGTSPMYLEVANNYAYVVDNSTDDLKVIDVSDPGAMSVVGVLSVGPSPVSVNIRGDHAYVVDLNSDDVKVIDVSDPSAPSLAGSLIVGGELRPATVSGNFAYVVDADAGTLNVIDVADPAAPTLAASTPVGTYPTSVAVSGNHAFVPVGGASELKVVDLFCANDPHQVVYDPVTGEFSSAPTSWQVNGDNVYVTDERVGIGTDSPSAKLDVRDASASEFRLSLSNSHWSKLRFSSSEGLRIEAKNEGVEFRPMLLIGSELRFMSGTSTTPERMRLASNGYLGIGTTTPIRPLHVTQGSGNPNVVLVEATGSPQAYLRFNDANTTNNANQPYIGSQGDAFTINTGGAEAIRVAADKDVQLNGFTKLGTDAPAVKMYYQAVPIDTSAAQFGNTVVDLPSYLTHENIVDVQILAHKYGPAAAGGEILTDQSRYFNGSGTSLSMFSWEIRRYSSLGQTNSFIIIGNNQINIGGIFPDGTLPYYKILITYIE